jgi:hypothetical protein
MMMPVRVPIACTLTSTDAMDRTAEWRHFLGECVVAASRTDHELRLTLAPEDATLLRAVDLAAREKACCAFFSFSIEIAADSRVLVIAVPAEGADVLDGMTALLPPEAVPGYL